MRNVKQFSCVDLVCLVVKIKFVVGRSWHAPNHSVDPIVYVAKNTNVSNKIHKKFLLVQFKAIAWKGIVIEFTETPIPWIRPLQTCKTVDLEADKIKVWRSFSSTLTCQNSDPNSCVSKQVQVEASKLTASKLNRAFSLVKCITNRRSGLIISIRGRLEDGIKLGPVMGISLEFGEVT